MARFGGDKPSVGSKNKKERKKVEKFVPMTGWEPPSLEDDYGISSWMQWQHEGCFRKRRPTELDIFRNLPLVKCNQIEDVVGFEVESLSEGFRKNNQHSAQFNSDKEVENIRQNSAEEQKAKPNSKDSESFRQCKSACAVIGCDKPKTESASKLDQEKNISSDSSDNKLNSDTITDAAVDTNDDGYESKISSSEDNGTEICPVPLLDLVGVTDEIPNNKSTSFRWLREKDDNVNNKVVKVTYEQPGTDALNTSVHRHTIINSSRQFVTNYIKRCQPSYVQEQTRPKSLVMLSKVGIQDSNLEIKETTVDNSTLQLPKSAVSQIHNTSPELNVSNLVTRTVSNRSASRQSPSRNCSRLGSYKSVDSKRYMNSNNDGQTFFPMKDLLPAVDQNIQDKQQERYTKQSVQEYYGNIGCGEKGDDVTSIEALSRSLDKYIGPPPFRPHYLRSPLQRAREQSTKRVHGSLMQLPDGSETYKICTPRYYIDKSVKSVNQRVGSADRATRVRLCLFGSGATKSADPRRKSAQFSARKSRERTIQTTNLIKRMMRK